MPTDQAIIELYQQSRQTNLAHPWRKGQLLELTGPGEVIMTGDLHGHERNFDKIVRFAALLEPADRPFSGLARGGQRDDGCEASRHKPRSVSCGSAPLPGCGRAGFPAQLHLPAGGVQGAARGEPALDENHLPDGETSERARIRAPEEGL